MFEIEYDNVRLCCDGWGTQTESLVGLGRGVAQLVALLLSAPAPGLGRIRRGVSTVRSVVFRDLDDLRCYHSKTLVCS